MNQANPAKFMCPPISALTARFSPFTLKTVQTKRLDWKHPSGFCTQRLTLSHASLRLPPVTPRLAPFRSGFGSGVQCMGTVTYRIARTRDAFLIHTLPHDSIRLIFTRKIAFVSTLCVWN